MPYIGRDLNRGNYLKLDDISSSFNGSTQTFNLTVGGSAFTPGSAFSILVSVGGVIQEPESAYQVENSEITFANAPTAQDSFFCIALGVALGIGVPGNGTVNGTQMAKPFNYDGYFYLDDTNNRVGVGSLAPTSTLDVRGDAKISGILTATSYSGPISNPSGISTFYDLKVTNNLTVEGSTTTLDTVVTEVDKLEVAADNTTVGVAITQSGTGDILNLYDGSSEVFSVTDGGITKIKKGLQIIPETNTLYALDGTLSYYGTTNGVYLNGAGASGWLRLNASGVTNDRTAINLYGQNIGGFGDQIHIKTASEERIKIGSDGKVGINTTDTTHLVTVFALSANTVIARFKAVNGNSNFDIATDASSHGSARVRNNLGAIKVQLNSNGDSYFTGGSVGIGTDNPAAKLQITKGASGGATANTDAALIVDNSSHTYVQFRTPNNKEQGLLFGDDADNDAGTIIYNHSDNALTFGTNGGASEKLRITSDGRVFIGESSVAGSARFVVGNGGAENFEFTSGMASSYEGGVLEYIHRGDGNTRPNLNYYVNNTGAHKFWTAGSERLSIQNDGKIAVGAGGNVGFATDTNTYIEQDGYDRISFTVGGLKTVSMIEAGTNYPVLLVDKNGTNTSKDMQGAGYYANPHANDLIIGNVSSGNHGMTICTPSSGHGNINFSDGNQNAGHDSYRGAVGYNHSTEQMIVRAKSGAVILKNNATDTLVAASSGRVGIGTDNPGRLLTLFGNDQPVFQITNNTSGTANTRGSIFYQMSGTTTLAIDNQGNGSGGNIQFMAAGNNTVLIESGGGFKFNGQGTSIPVGGILHHTNNNLYVRGGTNGLILGNQNNTTTIQIYNGNIKFETNDGTEKLRIDSSGYLKHTGLRSGNNENKLAILTTPSYNTGEEDVTFYIAENESGMNQITFGGGTSAYNAATSFRFMTASAVNTTTGTERLRIDSSGRVMINNLGNATPGLSANADDLVIGYGTQSAETGISMYSTTASGIRFNDNSGTDGAIEYAHNARELRFNAANGVRLAFSVNAADSPVFNLGVTAADYNNHNKGDRTSVKVGDYLSIESARGAGHNSRAGLGYNCYFHSLEDFYCGTNSPSGGDNRPAAYGMAYGNHYFYCDATNTAHSAQAQLTMSRVMEIKRTGSVVIRHDGATTSDGHAGLEIRAAKNKFQLVVSSSSATASDNQAKIGFKLHPSGQDERIKGAIVVQGNGGGYGEMDFMSFCLDTVADNGNTGQIYNDERVRIMTTGFMGPIPRTGTWQGTYVYRQQNQGANYEHKIRGPMSGYLDTEMDTNSVAYIKVQTLGTGVNDAYCEYVWSQDGENAGASLTHVRGNSGSSSNRPYMVLDGEHPCWKTAHSTQYNYVIRVEVTGGDDGQTYTSTGSYAAN